jgi:hypothetical protein
MPRAIRQVPVLKLALSISASALALGVKPDHISDALESGELVCRVLPGGRKRIPVFGQFGLSEWFDRFPRYVKPLKGPSDA